MPVPVIAATTLATKIGLGLAVADIGFSLWDTFGPDPVEDKIDEVNDKLDEITGNLNALRDNLRDLGEGLMEEFQVTQNLILTTQINDATAEAEAAYAQLQRYQRTANPSEGQRLDTINTAESALLRVLAQSESLLNGDDPISALGFVGSVTLAASVRLQIAFELERGAVGTFSINDGLSRSAEVLREIEATAIPQLEEAQEISTSASYSQIGGLGGRATYVTNVKSLITETVEETTNYVDYPYYLAYIIDRATRITTYSNELSEDVAQQDYEELGFDQLLKTAEGYEDLADGDDIVGNDRDNTLNGTEGNDLITGLGGDDTINGRDDGDVLRGNTGQDLIKGGDGFDFLLGGRGNDKLRGQKDGDSLQGGRGKDNLKGGSGDDLLDGGRGADVLIGGRGADDLIGGKQNDILKGGKGSDDFIFKGKFGKDVILDFNAKNRNEDIDLSGVDQIKNFRDLSNNHMSQKGDDVMIKASKNSILIEDTDLSDLGANDFIF